MNVRRPPSNVQAERLKDGGRTSERVFQPEKRAARPRPLCASIPASILGGYHTAGDRYIGPSRSVIAPEALEAPGVVDTIRHWRQPFDLRSRAIGVLQIEQDRTGVVLGQPVLDLPYQPLTLLYIGFGRLPFDHLVDLKVAIAVPVQAGARSDRTDRASDQDLGRCSAN